MSKDEQDHFKEAQRIIESMSPEELDHAIRIIEDQIKLDIAKLLAARWRQWTEFWR